ncbi:hypothetical protein DFJ74DRAFT_671683 [Hyaloraphidium curvatum]|nr:hypothetical protein DFJ74DRAFT_671683 [Hyaloraphidium curvatum]
MESILSCLSSRSIASTRLSRSVWRSAMRASGELPLGCLGLRGAAGDVALRHIPSHEPPAAATMSASSSARAGPSSPTRGAPASAPPAVTIGALPGGGRPPPSPSSARSSALQGTLDILSRWASIVTAPSVYQRQQDEDFWRTGPGAGVVRGGQTVGVPRGQDPAPAGPQAGQRKRRAGQGPPLSFRPGLQTQKTIISPVRVEPKVQFANERTFLGWMHYAVILTTISITLLNYGDRIAQITGLIFTFFSLLTMLYGLILFLWRGHRIRQRVRMPYDDLKGPPALMAVLFVGTFVNFAVRWAYLAREDGGEP